MSSPNQLEEFPKFSAKYNLSKESQAIIVVQIFSTNINKMCQNKVLYA